MKKEIYSRPFVGILRSAFICMFIIALFAAFPASSFSDTLPAVYDLRDSMPKIKDQGDFGNCWAFSVVAAASSNLIKKGIAKPNEINLSEWYIAYYAYHDESFEMPAFSREKGKRYFDGLSEVSSTALLSRGTGFVLYDEAPYPDSSENTYKPKITQRTFKIKNVYDFYVSDYEDSFITSSRRNRVKKMIMNHGAVVATIRQDDNALNEKTGAFFRGSDTASYDHSIAIVGWDDDYPKEKFKAANRPSAKGAWIIRNSWGTDWGLKGYAYVSYEEGSLCHGTGYDVEPALKNERIYQYDPLGATNFLSTGDFSPIMANIFTAQGNDTITSVAFYTAKPEMSCEIEVYAECSKVSPNTGKSVAKKKIKIEIPGYHTVDLDNPIRLKAGTRFSVVVSMDSKDKDAYILPAETQIEGISERITSRPGESWLYFEQDKCFYDLTELAKDFPVYENTNFCIKAIAVKGN